MNEPAPSPTGRPAAGPTKLRRWLRRLLIAWVVLLAASHVVRHVRGTKERPAPTLDDTTRQVELPEQIARDRAVEATDRTVRFVWDEWPARESVRAEAPTILLLHGSPGGRDNFVRLGPMLAERGWRVLAPDLPGFGDSQADVADYSILAHAGYCLGLLEHLGVERVHAVGFSMGGGVVLEMERLSRERGSPKIESLTLLSAIGVQELELLGDYTINHAIHGAQLAGLWFLFEAVPHFGVLDRPFLDIPYARNFYDTDQRPLRGILERYQGPLLILHGRDDFLVPFEAALEHERIVPQARLVTFEASHFMVFAEPQILVDPLVDFFAEVEAGEATLRTGADPERLRLAAEGTPYRLPRAAGPGLLVWIFLLAVATFVSEDLTCIAAGLLVAHGSLGFVAACIACGLGIFVGDIGLYLFGRLGRPWLARAPLRWFVRPAAVRRSEAWFARRGTVVIFLSRFLPGTRLATYVAAGLLGMGWFRFTLSLLIPVALWVPLIVWLSSRLGTTFLDAFQSLEGWAVPALLGALVTTWIILGLLRAVATWRGRRRLVGRWRRWTRWEFWPPWLFYPPVVLYVLGLGLRHRSLTLFTAANPAVGRGGGFVGESKSEILDGFDPTHVARFARLPDDKRRMEAVDAFRDGRWPVVLKPDVGQRGAGVVIARSNQDVERFLAATPGPAIVQDFVEGPELGIFWIRLPDEQTGRIFSVTDKRLPEVVGDGTSTLERLILEDPRAVAMAPTYLERFEARLEDVPPAGKGVRLVDVGTHCLGAVFLDGSHVLTPELEAQVDRIGRSCEGFDFGRFDLRAPSFEHFRRGEGLRVLEANGVTSEATHIYDPKNSLLRAYRILFEQWRLAFEVGRRRRAQGHEPLGLPTLARMAMQFLLGSRT